ncbi:MAG: transporter substrate-binding domain-containing protein [Erysipelotrichaceae bacterium]|nr:transporter substrate-binding domain-containing protein [Erysipelotrichaceae bacterium]
MKKLAVLALAGMMAVSMFGCGAKKKVEVSQASDLAELTVGVQTGTTGDDYATAEVKDDSQMKRYNKGADAVQALKTGKIDCVVIDSLPAQKFVEANDDLKIIENIWEPEEYAICLKKGNTELQEKMNAAMAELKEEGTLDKIMANYIGDDQGSFQYETPEGTEYPNGKLVMATNAEFAPWEYKEGSDIVGIDPDVVKAICDKMGYELEISDMAFEAILAAVDSGKADFGAAGMTVNAERLESVDFTDTYANASQVVIVRK